MGLVKGQMIQETNSVDKKVFVTGVSSGIGYEFCKLCLERNCHVTGVVREDSQRELFSNEKDHLEIVQADLSKKEDLSLLFQSISNKAYDYIVLNAGFAKTGLFHEQSLDLMEKTIRVNLLSNMWLVHQLLPKAIESNTKFVFVSSISARLPAYNFASYATSKAGLSHFCNSLRREYPSVSFLCAEIGPVNTPMHKKSNNVNAHPVKFKSSKFVARRLYQSMLKKQGFVTLSWDWWLMRKIAMSADELMTRLMIKK